jgi:hypothetical protein
VGRDVGGEVGGRSFGAGEVEFVYGGRRRDREGEGGETWEWECVEV